MNRFVLVTLTAALLFVASYAWAGASPATAQTSPPTNATTNDGHTADPAADPSQGCVNQGRDRREFATVICWMQRQFSWRSEHEPYYMQLGPTDGTHLGIAWPPYLVFNSPDGNGQWSMARIGFRYDTTWRGYIFPTVALKRIAHPLRY